MSKHSSFIYILVTSLIAISVITGVVTYQHENQTGDMNFKIHIATPQCCFSGNIIVAVSGEIVYNKFYNINESYPEIVPSIMDLGSNVLSISNENSTISLNATEDYFNTSYNSFFNLSNGKIFIVFVNSITNQIEISQRNSIESEFSDLQ